MRFIGILFTALILCTSSCEKATADTPIVESMEGVFIRVENASVYDFNSILVTDKEYEDLAPGAKSDYQAFEMAYRYAYINLEIDGSEFTIQPIDFVGETLLEDGNYTYQLSANDSNEQYGRLGITLIED